MSLPATLILRHAYSDETRTVDVLSVHEAWKLEIRWGLAGLYWFDIKKDALMKGRTPLPWVAADKDAAIALWHRESYPRGAMAPVKTRPAWLDKGRKRA